MGHYFAGVVEAGDNQLVERLKENRGFAGELHLRMEVPAHI